MIQVVEKDKTSNIENHNPKKKCKGKEIDNNSKIFDELNHSSSHYFNFF